MTSKNNTYTLKHDTEFFKKGTRFRRNGKTDIFEANDGSGTIRLGVLDDIKRTFKRS